MLKGNTDEAVEFLRAFHPTGPWHLLAMQPDGKPIARTFQAHQIKQMEAWIEAHQGTHNMYFSVNELKSTVANRKAQRADVQEGLYLHVDIDDLQSLARLERFSPKPTAVVFSGGGYQAFWHLSQPCDDLDKLEEANKKLETFLGGDHCHNADRIMRAPGTINVPNEKKRKRGRVPVVAHLVTELTDWSRITEIDKILQLGPSSKKYLVDPDQIEPATIEALPISLSPALEHLIRVGDDLQRPKGSSDPRFPTRSEAVYSLILSLIRLGCPDELIVGILINPTYGISASVLEKPKPIDYALRQVTNGHRDAENWHKQSKRQQKDTLAQICLKITEDEDVQLFHDKLQQGYMTVPWGESGTRTFRLKSQGAEQWIRRAFYQATGKPLSAQVLKDTIETLEAKAIFDGPQETVSVRIAKVSNRIFIDLGTEDGAVICVSGDGWSTLPNSPTRFLRLTGFGELPIPERGGDLADLQQLLSLDKQNWVLFLAFLLNCLKGDGPFLCSIIEGEQGSGKSLLCEIVKQLLDPSAAPKLRMPKDEHSLMIQASQNVLLVFDNVSGMKWDMSDALCALSTGSGFSTRRFYTDDDARIFQFCRPFVLNGIGGYANRPDLLERAINLKLQPIPQGQRRSEHDIWAVFRQNHGKWLGCLLDIIVVALRRYDEVKAPATIRMADAARWLVAAEPATSFSEGTFIKVLKGSQDELVVDRILDLPLTQALLELVRHTPFEGTMGELHKKITRDHDFRRPLPKTSAHLSTELKRVRPGLELIGLHVTIIKKKDRKGRMVRVTADEYEPVRQDV